MAFEFSHNPKNPQNLIVSSLQFKEVTIGILYELCVNNSITFLFLGNVVGKSRDKYLVTSLEISHNSLHELWSDNMNFKIVFIVFHSPEQQRSYISIFKSPYLRKFLPKCCGKD